MAFQTECQPGDNPFLFVLRSSEVGLFFLQAEGLCSFFSLNGDGHLARISNLEEYNLVGEFLDGFFTPVPGEDELWIGLFDPGKGFDSNAQHERGDYQFIDGIDSDEIREFISGDVPWFSNDPDLPLTQSSCVVWDTDTDEGRHKWKDRPCSSHREIFYLCRESCVIPIFSPTTNPTKNPSSETVFTTVPTVNDSIPQVSFLEGQYSWMVGVVIAASLFLVLSAFFGFFEYKKIKTLKIKIESLKQELHDADGNVQSLTPVNGISPLKISSQENQDVNSIVTL